MQVVEEDVREFLSSHGRIFHQPWWLEMVTEPFNWQVGYAVVRRGADVAAVLPYTQRDQCGLRLLEMPRLTPYLGPVLRQSTAKYTNRLSEEKALVTELIDQLPRYDLFYQAFDPRISNWLPFYWRGFKQTTLYTYQFKLEMLKNLDSVWTELRENIRTDIKKARKLLTVCEEGSIDVLLRQQGMTHCRQGTTSAHSEAFMQQVSKTLRDHACSKVLIAQDAKGRIHGAALFIWDSSKLYYLMSGADPAIRSSGVSSLLIWSGIELAASLGLAFDFEGSMVESIERFFRSFGARQTPYFAIRQTPSRMARVLVALREKKQALWPKLG